jgi:hypothetical protein
MKHATLLPALLAAIVTGCGDFASHDEVARVRSPDGKIDAVLVESNGGATTSLWYDVHVVEAGASYRSESSVAHLYGAGRNESAFGVNLVWLNSAQVEVQFLSAQTSSVSPMPIRLAGVEVSVSLRPGIVDAKAPPGGMLYNLERPQHGS